MRWDRPFTALWWSKYWYNTTVIDKLVSHAGLTSLPHRKPYSLLQTLHDMLTIAFDSGNRAQQMLSSEGRKLLIQLLREELSYPSSLLQLCRGEVWKRWFCTGKQEEALFIRKCSKTLNFYNYFNRLKWNTCITKEPFVELGPQNREALNWLPIPQNLKTWMNCVGAVSYSGANSSM